MRFSCTQENLIHGLNVVSKVAARSGNLPILSHVCIKASNEGITLKATNLEIGVTCNVRGKVDEPGEFTVPSRLFTDYLSSLPKERVDVTLNEQTLSLVCAGHRTKINGVPASDFPLIPAVEDGEVRTVSLPAFLEGLEQILFTISPTETRPEISGALLGLEGNTLVLTGTDSYRLAEKTLLIEGKGKNLRAVAPLRALQELARICMLLKEESGTVKLVISPNQMAVSLPAVEFVSRLIDGQYPDYQAIVPTKFGVSAIISRAEFISGIRAAGLFSKAGVYDIAVTILPSAGQVRLDALNSQTGEYASSITAEVAGTETKIAFNWKYLLEGVQALQGDKFMLKATDSASPTMLMEAGGGDYFYIVMPIKE